MKVKDLIASLEQIDPEARIFTGYDGNVVVEQADSVEFIATEHQIGDCWWSVKVGDVVILAS